MGPGMGVRGHFMIVAALAALAAAADPAFAQSLRAELSSEEAEVGESLELQVTVVNPTQAGAPVPPRTADFQIRPVSAPPTQSSRVNIVNGVMTQEVSYTYRFRVQPVRTGNLILPPFTVKDGSRTLSTRPIRVSVGQAVSGPHVSCEIETPGKVAYVGQSVTVALRIKIRKFRQQNFLSLRAEDMWSLRDGQACSWGIFADPNASIGVQEVREPDENGIERECFVFTIETTTYPNKVGPFEFGEIEFVYKYPIQISRTMLGYQLERSRRLSVKPEKPEFTVRSVPRKDRPPSYNGAIGTFTMTASARPTEMPVGDPITLALSIRGASGLQRLTPPRLERVEELIRDFEVSSDIPGGTIEGDRKVFNVTIRPLREDVKEIPALPLSYFNPRSERFETTLSRPIPIRVLPAVKLALPEPQQGPALPGVGVLAPLVETTEGLLPNYRDPALLLADQTATVGAGTWTVLAGMPVLYFAAWLGHARTVRLRTNQALRRRSQALAGARRRLSAASTGPGEIRAALLGYIADCCNVPAGGLTRADALRLSLDHGAGAESVARLDALLEQLEYAEFGGGAAVADASEARALIDELEQGSFHR